MVMMGAGVAGKQKPSALERVQGPGPPGPRTDPRSGLVGNQPDCARLGSAAVLGSVSVAVAGKCLQAGKSCRFE